MSIRLSTAACHAVSPHMKADNRDTKGQFSPQHHCDSFEDVVAFRHEAANERLVQVSVAVFQA